MNDKNVEWEKCFVCPSLVVETIDERIKRKHAKSVNQACHQLSKESEGTWPSESIRTVYNRANKVVSNDTKMLNPSYDTCTVDDLYKLIESGKTFSTIYADPPWRYSNQGSDNATSRQYETLTIPEIMELPIKALTTKNAHLHLWTTSSFIFECPQILEAWGFDYKSMFVWCKSGLGMGNYWRVTHELLITGIKGKLVFLDHNQRSWLEIRRGKHSQKPEEIADIVEKVSPGPYLELFGRRARKGWTVWGNEIHRSLFDGV